MKGHPDSTMDTTLYCRGIHFSSLKSSKSPILLRKCVSMRVGLCVCVHNQNDSYTCSKNTVLTKNDEKIKYVRKRSTQKNSWNRK